MLQTLITRLALDVYVRPALWTVESVRDLRVVGNVACDFFQTPCSVLSRVLLSVLRY